ncbi:hypothetical protein HH308_06480 [Gordonia sp. TBRC 11910]|uniref:Putative exodeoxyribonuclease 8 PDDEXK-like domain-containing protein n=1 Tax=Gordonia asplenii TaxID=2725283 RepID=A0A848KZI4_9ACTN|nr:PD-(D/E)XK nuclease-like domain-containing protein [Gordonia asplenii]NMO00858.1 hypothetical protein [Gordonia asplenii]
MTVWEPLPDSAFKPGVYAGVTDADYHGDLGSLSSSGARNLLHPSTPDDYRRALVTREEKKALDVGHIIHSMILGVGMDVLVVDAKDWRTDKAKALKQEAYDSGRVPMLKKEMAPRQAAADAMLTDPVAGPLLEEGQPELSIWLEDPETGVMLRARPDWSRLDTDRPYILDVKTTDKTARPSAFGAHAAKYGYHCQQPFYVDAITGSGYQEPTFLFAVVEISEPYRVSVNQLDSSAVQLGRTLNRHAIDRYAQCRATNEWPSWQPRIHMTDIPKYSYYDAERALQA